MAGKKSKTVEWEMMKVLLLHKKTAEGRYLLHASVLEAEKITTADMKKYLRKALADLEELGE